MFRFMPTRFLMLAVGLGIFAVAQGRAAPFADPPKPDPKPDTPKVWLTTPQGNSQGDVVPLAYGRLWPLQSAIPFRIEAIPDDAAIDMDFKEGPKDIFALWAGDKDDYIWKPLGADDKGKFFVTIRAKKGVAARTTIMCIPEAVAKDTVIPRFTLEVNGGAEPPSPADALTASLMAVYRQDAAADKAASVAKLASLCRTVANSLAANNYAGDDTIAKLRTQKDFNTQWQEARESMIDGKIPAVRRVMGEYLDTKWNRDPASPFDVPAKKKAADALNYVATKLEGVK